MRNLGQTLWIKKPPQQHGGDDEKIAISYADVESPNAKAQILAKAGVKVNPAEIAAGQAANRAREAAERGRGPIRGASASARPAASSLRPPVSRGLDRIPPAKRPVAMAKLRRLRELVGAGTGR